ncbi:MAG: hypothetical protein GF311_11650 [Candidatus Lokiarchaeota archaeon]|nr:hypothetical protein [Candidatus Lokiarchaeota archaeon]
MNDRIEKNNFPFIIFKSKNVLDVINPKLRISEIFPIIDSEQIETDIKKHLKNIADKNSIE